MIVPLVGLKFHQFQPVKIDDEILLVKEKENLFEDNSVAAYNHQGEQIGYVSSRSTYNAKVNAKMKEINLRSKVFSIGRNQILVELAID